MTGFFTLMDAIYILLLPLTQTLYCQQTVKSVGRSDSPRFRPTGSPFALQHSSPPLTHQSQLHSAAGNFLSVPGHY